ncbi:hypothetical protein V6Z11_D02G186600 [Gossypium hirsutum]
MTDFAFVLWVGFFLHLKANHNQKRKERRAQTPESFKIFYIGSKNKRFYWRGEVVQEERIKGIKAQKMKSWKRQIPI